MWGNHKNVFPKSQHVERCTIDKRFQFRFRIPFRINFIQNCTIKTQLLKREGYQIRIFFLFSRAFGSVIRFKKILHVILISLLKKNL